MQYSCNTCSWRGCLCQGVVELQSSKSSSLQPRGSGMRGILQSPGAGRQAGVETRVSLTLCPSSTSQRSRKNTSEVGTAEWMASTWRHIPHRAGFLPLFGMGCAGGTVPAQRNPLPRQNHRSCHYYSNSTEGCFLLSPINQKPYLLPTQICDVAEKAQTGEEAGTHIPPTSGVRGYCSQQLT